MFKKNKIDIKKLAQTVKKESNLCRRCLRFLEDSGNYKRIKDHYRLSDHEVKEKIKEIKSNMLNLQINMTIATEVISQNKKQTELFIQTIKDLEEDFLNQKNEIKKKEK